ncbi:MAG TPA: hypothetical protein VFI47_05025 [Acidimicrobiales bacterium]|nr:hypothetical protein [Acidimicrobiales bacterium]
MAGADEAILCEDLGITLLLRGSAVAGVASLRCAGHYERVVAGRMLVAMTGLPGTGKSVKANDVLFGRQGWQRQRLADLVVDTL